MSLIGKAIDFRYFIPLEPRYRSTPKYMHGVDAERKVTAAYADVCPYVLDIQHGLPMGSRAAVIHSAVRWRQSGNPAHALCAIAAASNACVYPHPELMAWLSHGIGEWLAAEDGSLDSAILGARRGREKALNAAKNDAFKFELCGEIFTLSRAFGLSVEEAAECVEARLYQDLEGNEKPGRKIYSASTLQQYYSTEVGEYWRRLAVEPAALFTGDGSWSQSERESLAMRYPLHVRDRFLKVKSSTNSNRPF